MGPSLLPIRTPLRPPSPESLISSRGREGISTLIHADPFATIVNPRKCKVHSEVFSVFTVWPRGNDPNHVILGDAGLAMAKRILHPPEAERWPSAEASAFMNKQLTLVPDQRMSFESDLYLEPFLKEHEKNPSYKQAYDLKIKMFSSLMAQRSALVPLFKLLDSIVEVKQKV